MTKAPEPQDIDVNKIRYDLLAGQVRADKLLFAKDRPINAMDVDAQKLIKLEVMKGKMEHTAKYKTDMMMMNRAAVKRYVNSYGFFCSRRLADALNTVVLKMIDEAIGRVYTLPGRMERITVRPSDLPMIVM